MAKKATLVKRAQKLGLDITMDNKLPEIHAALEAHARSEAEKAPETPPSEPQEPVADNSDSAVSIELPAPQNEEYSLKGLLLLYNSITPSRRRWVNNRNELRNRWKELFELLEKMSGRDGRKADVFDPNWHKVEDKGVTTGAVNRDPEDVHVFSDINEVERLRAQLASTELELATTKGKLEDLEMAITNTTPSDEQLEEKE